MSDMSCNVDDSDIVDGQHNAAVNNSSNMFIDVCRLSRIPSFEQVSAAFDEWTSSGRDEYRRLPNMTLGLQWALALRYPFMIPDASDTYDNEHVGDIIDAVSNVTSEYELDTCKGYMSACIPDDPMVLIDVQGVADSKGHSDDNEHIWTFFNDFPHGWLVQFGIEMLEDIRNALLHEGGIDRLLGYHVLQIKEKFGGIRFYADTDSDVTSDIISCYEALSYLCCIDCGSFANVRLTHGWVTPVCYDCWDRQYHEQFTKFVECTSPGAPNGAKASMGYTIYTTNGNKDVDLYELYIGNCAKTISRYGDSGLPMTLADELDSSDDMKRLHVVDVYKRYIAQMNG